MKTNVYDYHDMINNKYYASKLPSEIIRQSKDNIIQLLNHLDPNESEEHNKNLIRDFIINNGYKSSQVNTSKRIDLAISSDGYNNVIIETKDLNSREMIKHGDLNRKALHELILYFMREYLLYENNHLTYLIASDGIDWFIFDAKTFKKIFVDDKLFVKQFNNLVSKSLTDSSTDNFYNKIAKPKVETILDNLKYYYFSFSDYVNKKDISERLGSNVYKLFSPVTMLKKTFISDSNHLNVNFYNELLYIMGLEENDSGIERVNKNDRQRGSLFELVSLAIDGTRRFGEVSPSEKFDDVINISMSLINRLLFLKLLEGQLVSFNNNEKYKFLNYDNIKSFSDIDDLFFKILAVPVSERIDYLKDKYPYIPYLNSSLFERTKVEQDYEFYPMKLRDNFSIRIYQRSILKHRINKDKKEEFTLKYLIDFLNSYSFGASTSSFNNQQIINPSILGSIFEKINGYKDGSYFTPGFVTSYMSETGINRALINKFNRDGFKINKLDDLVGVDNNVLINELNDFHVIDPSVGSGHFLVSALNYLVKIRNDLGLINPYINANYNMRIINDELIVDNEVLGSEFSYTRGIEMSTNIQKSLFNAKIEIIENNLFGVDINSNSVNITKLRLWIELLKNSYYEESNLVTMPNLEMNIKNGNSLISRYTLNEPLSNVSQGTNVTVSNFKKVVSEYKNTSNKEQKYQIETDIEKFKNSIIKSINKNSINDRLRKLYQKYNEAKLSVNLLNSNDLQKQRNIEIKEYHDEIKRIEKNKGKLLNNELFKDSFEWRFEFPELLNSSGKFIGFDLVIANPPYINMDNNREIFSRINKTSLGEYSHGRMNIFYYFIHLALNLLNSVNGTLAFITTDYWLTNDFADVLRNDLRARSHIFRIIDFVNYRIFSSAMGQNNLIIESDKGSQKGNTEIIKTNKSGISNPSSFINIVNGKDEDTYYGNVAENYIYDNNGRINISVGENNVVDDIVKDLRENYDFLGKYVYVRLGITAAPNAPFIMTKSEFNELKDELNDFELSLIKPILNGTSIDSYFEHDYFDNYIMYITNDVKKSQIPNLIKRMLNVYPGLDKEPNKNGKSDFFVLLRPRKISEMQSKSTIFGPKLAEKPVFMMNNNEYVIKDDSRFIYSKDPSITSDELLILLNSTLARFLWIYNGVTKGKSIILKQSSLDVIPLIRNRDNMYDDVSTMIQEMKNDNDIKSLQIEIDSLVNKWFSIDDTKFKYIIEYLDNNE